MKVRSLKSRLSLLLSASLCIFGLVIVTSVYIYYRNQSESLIKTTQEKLKATVQSQADTILISFLIPEQKSGLNLLLKKFKEEESLDESKILPLETEIAGFSKCLLKKTQNYCLSDDQKKIGIVSPIMEGESLYGYYFKAKAIELGHINRYFWTVAILVILTLVIAFLVSFFILMRITSIEIPRYLNSLTDWLSEALKEKKSPKAPRSGFEEFDKLTDKIEKTVTLRNKEKNEKMELQKAAAIGKIASQVAHDMRTPILIIEGSAEALKKGDHSKQNIESIVDASKWLEGIAEDLLKKQRTQMEVFKEDKRAYLLLADIIDFQTSGIKAQVAKLGIQNFTLNTNLSFKSRDIKIFGNKTALQRAIGNITRNALEALSLNHGNESTLKFDLTENDDIAIIEIADNGPGIPKDIQDKILKKRVTKNKEKGNGQGLLYVREVISRHNGKIDFETSPSGTTFRISLPIPKDLRTIKVKGQQPVLVIDDDQTMLDMWKDLLGSRQIPVETHEKYSAELESKKYSCIISDYDLGDTLDGITVLKKFANGIPRYLCTGYSHESHILKQANEESILVISKPPLKEKYTVETIK